ncbi:hypothetical protein UFOVP59_34 [uncultured Caudovirales phage]|uniref:Uncharacterized protein n=1 Tax=uncultured Caudovirales phage TaxID=2100421 RepID=A0A6J5KU18_9CAUD|nr:hypothetical protein UFOVP59_34 [uncultured Caudovirales phage]CAB5221089.1 hypothetical protein UFOVP246_81 [uncultured Caudovirales phage]
MAPIYERQQKGSNMKEFSAKEVQEVLWGENDDYITVVPETLLDKGRWWVSYEQVVQCKSDDIYWKITWSEGSTEMQDCDFEPKVTEVVPVQVIVTKFIEKE